MAKLTEDEVRYLRGVAKQLRVDILKMITRAESGHTGGSLSLPT